MNDSSKPCKDCEAHFDYGNKLATLFTEMDHLKQIERDHRETFEKIFNALEKKCNMKAFVLLLSCLIMIFIFILGSQFTIHQKVNDIAVQVTVVEKTLKGTP